MSTFTDSQGCVQYGMLLHLNILAYLALLLFVLSNIILTDAEIMAELSF